MIFIRTLLTVCFVVSFAACAKAPAGHAPDKDLGLLWVKHAAEYDAITRQVYGFAQRDLQRFVDDTSWSAMPEQENAANLPPAIILDVDETVLSNVDFQLTFERPFANQKLDDWSKSRDATPVAGLLEFATAAQNAGVELFFLTNRPCQPIDGDTDACPQKRTTIADINELGIAADANHVMLSDEHPDWTREKIVRRKIVAQTHRVIMLIGDDLSDFVSCVREKAAAPCAQAATHESREESVEAFGRYWGAGWYILPNPMHGSWTTTI
jgi:acid phosphatase